MKHEPSMASTDTPHASRRSGEPQLDVASACVAVDSDDELGMLAQYAPQLLHPDGEIFHARFALNKLCNVFQMRNRCYVLHLTTLHLFARVVI